MRILISPIGNRDPYDENGHDGAALTIAKSSEYQPDLIYLIPTAPRRSFWYSTHEKAEETSGEIKRLFPSMEVYIIDMFINKPTKFDEISLEIDRIFSLIQDDSKKFHSESEYYLNITSGTQQIQTSCLLAAASSDLKIKVLQVPNPKYSSGRWDIQEVPMIDLEESSIIENASKFYNNLMFEACIQELDFLKQISRDRPRCDVAEIWQLLCQSYSALDRLDYEESWGGLFEAGRRISHTQQFEVIEQLIIDQYDTSKKLNENDGKENKDVLYDIYHNAKRCFSRRAYADSLARVWRLIEGGLYYRLRENGINPIKPNQSDNRNLAINLWGEGRVIRDGYLSFSSSSSGLKEGDMEFREFLNREINLSDISEKNIEGAMHDSREARNSSIVAHGINPVSAETARDSLVIAEQLLLFLFPKSNIDDYLFAEERLYDIGERLLQVI